MSIVICDVSNQYCDDLDNSYQIVRNDGDTYSVYVSFDVLRGKTISKGLESFQDAWNVLNDYMQEVECL